MVDNYLWSPSDLNTNFNDYILYLKNKNLYTYSDYQSLHEWSVNNKEQFWSELWSFLSIIGEYQNYSYYLLPKLNHQVLGAILF